SPLPASSTLFPYTTLFRSLGGAFEAVGAHRVRSDPDQCRAAARAFGRHRERSTPDISGVDALHDLRDDVPGAFDAHLVSLSDVLDRKSTRLNSSHVKISYA